MRIYGLLVVVWLWGVAGLDGSQVWGKQQPDVTKIDPALAASRKTTDGLRWFDVTQQSIEGRILGDEPRERWFDRLPLAAKAQVTPAVWSLSQDSSGMVVRFVSDSPSLHVRCKFTKDRLSMVHMPATGVSGLDLYARDANGVWKWVQCLKPDNQTMEAELVQGLEEGKREYAAYLPLYNGLVSLEFGVVDGRLFEQLAPREKPIVFYGTSITQGACASRPGMVHTAILGRKLDCPIVNLGFSGNGQMDLAVGEWMAKIDAAVYVIDCLPNMGPDDVRAKCVPLVKLIRAKQPNTPIVLVEDRRFTNDWITPAKRRFHDANHEALKEAYLELLRVGVQDIEYIEGDELFGLDSEGATDASHASDLGFMRQAEAFLPVLRELVGKR